MSVHAQRRYFEEKIVYEMEKAANNHLYGL